MVEWLVVPGRLSSCTFHKCCHSINGIEVLSYLLLTYSANEFDDIQPCSLDQNGFQFYFQSQLCCIGGLRIRIISVNFIIGRPIEIGRTMCLLTDKLLYRCYTMCYFYRWSIYYFRLTRIQTSVYFFLHFSLPTLYLNRMFLESFFFANCCHLTALFIFNSMNTFSTRLSNFQTSLFC